MIIKPFCMCFSIYKNFNVIKYGSGFLQIFIMQQFINTVKESDLMVQIFKIHGDNIVECDRILSFISRKMEITNLSKYFISNAAIEVQLEFNYENSKHNWKLIFHPGFNKSNRARWKQNIFDPLKDAGSFLDETPDAIITKVFENGSKEEILCGIEFCSALQAGNQAWQRSGRAYSTIRTGCPYLYIVDFVKYELDTTTRERKAIRTPNSAVPYSYINNSKEEGVFGAQAFVKSEEFDDKNTQLANFDHSVFSEDEIADYLIKKMLGQDTKKIEQSILDKNKKMVDYFAINSNGQYYFKPEDWQEIYDGKKTVLELALKKKWQFGKKIAEKSITGSLAKFLALTKKYGYGITCKDLPFGVISKDNKPKFMDELVKLYPINEEDIQSILHDNSELVICLIKGFKPRGDDNRPDRGLLPFLAMLTSENTKVLTIIYGPMTRTRVEQIKENPDKVAITSGFWNAFLGLSDYLLLDVPLLNENTNATLFRNNHIYKEKCTSQSPKKQIISKFVSPIQNSIHEDDVDSAIHMLFTSLPSDKCFEGLCNPPGGDWSGLSVVVNNCEYRWVSLPRVSADVNGKRPDHVLQIFPENGDSIILSIESKDRSNDLEKSVGIQLKQYIRYLTTFIPSCQKPIGGEWSLSKGKMHLGSIKIISVAAFIDCGNEDYTKVSANSSCDLIFSLSPVNQGWTIKVINCMADNSIYQTLKETLKFASTTTGVTVNFD